MGGRSEVRYYVQGRNEGTKRPVQLSVRRFGIVDVFNCDPSPLERFMVEVVCATMRGYVSGPANRSDQGEDSVPRTSADIHLACL